MKNKLIAILILIILILSIYIIKMNNKSNDNIDVSDNNIANNTNVNNTNTDIINSIINSTNSSNNANRVRNLTHTPLPEGYERSIDKVTMKIKEGTLTNTSAIIIIEDTNEYPYSYDMGYLLQEKINNEWKGAEEIRINTSTGMPIHIGENQKKEQKIDWKRVYGELKPGQYRLIKNTCKDEKEVDEKEIYVEFDIK